MTAPSKTKFVVFEATTADLPTLVKIQFKAYASLPIELLANGHGTPEDQLSVLERHQSHIDQNSGLRIAKVEVEVPESQPENNENKNAIIGFCMFYFLNEDAARPELRVPPMLRPSTTWERADHIKDPKIRQLVENFSNETARQVLEVVAGRGECAYLRYMSVDPAYQRQGVGSLLMEWGCRLLDEKGLDAVLEATPQGQMLYQWHGFETIGWAEASDGTKDGVKFAIMWRTASKISKQS